MLDSGPLSRLVELGLSEYEGRAYLALLENSPITAYETARISGIPTSKIYEVFGRMIPRGLVITFSEGDRRLYAPQEAKEFLDSQKSKFKQTLSGLEQDLKDLGTKRHISYLWTISERQDLLTRALTSIDRSERELIVSLWPEEMDTILPALRGAAERGVRIAIVHFGTVRSALPGALYVHPIQDTLQSEKGGRSFALIADGQEALVGTILSDGKAEGVWSKNRGFVTIAEDYVKHDIYIMKIVNRYNDELKRKFGGENYHLLRDVFNDRTTDDV